MNEMIAFPSIESLRHVVKGAEIRCKINNLPLPKVDYVGTVKLHGCFSKDTLVTLADGSQLPISDIKVGMQVLSYDEDQKVVKPVTQVVSGESPKEWVRLTFDGTVIECTSDHLFFTANRGWVEAQNLTSDDEFITDY